MRKIIVIVVAMLLYTAGIIGQTAKVIALSPQDAAEAKALNDAQKALDARKAKFQDHITSQYLQDPRSDEGCEVTAGGPPYRPCATLRGWASGFIFSEDFKYIVPAADPPKTSCSVFGACYQPSMLVNTN
jgi:hypothetical protein